MFYIVCMHYNCSEYGTGMSLCIHYGRTFIGTLCAQAAMSAYSTAMSILKNNVGVEIPPEIYNNMAALHFWQGSLDEAKVRSAARLFKYSLSL